MKPLIVIAAVVLALVGGWFYWYEYRPTMITKSCNEQAKNKARELLKTKFELAEHFTPEKTQLFKAMNEGLFEKDDYEEYFKICLRENGS